MCSRPWRAESAASSRSRACFDIFPGTCFIDKAYIIDHISGYIYPGARNSNSKSSSISIRRTIFIVFTFGHDHPGTNRSNSNSSSGSTIRNAPFQEDEASGRRGSILLYPSGRSTSGRR